MIIETIHQFVLAGHTCRVLPPPGMTELQFAELVERSRGKPPQQAAEQPKDAIPKPEGVADKPAEKPFVCPVDNQSFRLLSELKRYVKSKYPDKAKEIMALYATAPTADLPPVTDPAPNTDPPPVANPAPIANPPPVTDPTPAANPPPVADLAPIADPPPTPTEVTKAQEDPGQGKGGQGGQGGPPRRKNRNPIVYPDHVETPWLPKSDKRRVPRPPIPAIAPNFDLLYPRSRSISGSLRDDRINTILRERGFIEITMLKSMAGLAIRYETGFLIENHYDAWKTAPLFQPDPVTSLNWIVKHRSSVMNKVMDMAVLIYKEFKIPCDAELNALKAKEPDKKHRLFTINPSVIGLLCYQFSRKHYPIQKRLLSMQGEILKMRSSLLTRQRHTGTPLKDASPQAIVVKGREYWNIRDMLVVMNKDASLDWKTV